MMKYAVVLFISLFILSCNNKNISKIEGEWNLYSNKFIRSENINAKPDKVLNFPGSFFDTLNNNNHKYGSITKRIEVIPHRKYTLYISGINSASRVWVDNELIREFGVIGKRREDVKPLVQPSLVNFSPTKDRVDITIEFSNFHLREDLIFKWMILGDSFDILNLYLKHQSKDYFSSGMLLIISILFFLLFITNTKSRYSLYFSLFSLSYGIRSFLMEKVSIWSVIPMSWELIYQFTKASELWALVFILQFFKELYPNELRNKFTHVLTIISLVFSLTPFIPLNIFSTYKFMFLFHSLVILTGNYFLMRLMLSVKRKRILAKLTFASLLLFSISTIIDILSNRYALSWGYVSAQAVILLVVTMCVLIAKERTSAISSINDKKNKNIKYRNIFTKFVPLEILKYIGNGELEDRAPGDFLVNPQTIAYIDIRDFTKLSQGLTPEENFIMINNFFKLVGSVVHENRGFIESYGGDGVKVVFPESTASAIKAAFAISDNIYESQRIKIGISIHVGNVVLGTIGSENRIQATSISRITRILNKMDHFNSKMGIEILVTDEVLSLVNLEDSQVLYLGTIKLKDEDDAINLYQLIPGDKPIDKMFRDAFENGVQMLKLRKYSKAYGFFKLANMYESSHKLSIYYINQLEVFLKLKQANFALAL